MSDGALFVPGAVLRRGRDPRRCRAAFGAARRASSRPCAGVVGPARYWRQLAAPGARSGIISAMTEHFCDDLQPRAPVRHRPAAHLPGAYDDATDLRTPCGAGRPRSERRPLERSCRAGMKRTGTSSRAAGCGGPRKHMVSIGG